MNEFEMQKNAIIRQLKSLCAHCSNNARHICKLKAIAREVADLSGVPLLVNDSFNGILLTR